MATQTTEERLEIIAVAVKAKQGDKDSNELNFDELNYESKDDG